VKHGHSAGLLGRRRLRWQEHTFQPGDQVAVAGRARWELNAAGSGATHREAPRQLVLEGGEHVPLFMSLYPKAR
jgi:hypothetical protein